MNGCKRAAIRGGCGQQCPSGSTAHNVPPALFMAFRQAVPAVPRSARLSPQALWRFPQALWHFPHFLCARALLGHTFCARKTCAGQGVILIICATARGLHSLLLHECADLFHRQLGKVGYLIYGHTFSEEISHESFIRLFPLCSAALRHSLCQNMLLPHGAHSGPLPNFVNCRIFLRHIQSLQKRIGIRPHKNIQIRGQIIPSPLFFS